MVVLVVGVSVPVSAGGPEPGGPPLSAAKSCLAASNSRSASGSRSLRKKGTCEQASVIASAGVFAVNPSIATAHVVGQNASLVVVAEGPQGGVSLVAQVGVQTAGCPCPGAGF